MNKEAVSGATAGFMATITLHPLDVIKTRLQVQDLQIATKYNGTLHAFKTILRNEGARGLYAGLSPAVVGNTASWAMYFAFYDRARKRYEKASNDDGEVEKKSISSGETLLAAAEAGVSAMRGRWFGGNRLDARLWDGATNYAKTGVADDETEAEQNARLEKFAADLERE